MNIEPFAVENRMLHRDPFEYEYRCTEYEYDFPNEHTF